MSAHIPSPSSAPETDKPDRLGWYRRIPLYVRILIALTLGILLGLRMHMYPVHYKPFIEYVLHPLSTLVLQLLRLLATPLIFVAVVHALMKANVSGRTGARLFYFLLTNTVVAIIIGLLVANVIHPGTFAHLAAGEVVKAAPFDPVHDLLDKVPANLISPFLDNEIISIIILAVSIGAALRIVRTRQETAGQTTYRGIENFLATAFDVVMVILHWIFDLVPLAVFAVVARTVGTAGIKPLLSMGIFVISVLLALAFQATFYLIRLRFGSWVRPGKFLASASDALTLAFSTASSAATLPVTYASVKDRMGVREESAGLGVMVGGTFNHDGTALYEAMAALFIGQALGQHLGLGQQIVVVLMAIIASVGAAGIPEAGLVTMLAVFSAVHLPTEYIPLLLPLDWFLDRCRTMINVMGDMTVTCLLDGKQQATDVSPEMSAEEMPAVPLP